ncbi:hypothetical protein [Bacillus sp. Marseille-P3800]|uniref:hypothetical protein n=1 Tax=Bacillus sp. Marseille-P3800 TaxID=2014782 RepID=UPI000C08277F|nr:hypothetical protein [Bacillus sp. Marseille-P3800]
MVPTSVKKGKSKSNGHSQQQYQGDCSNLNYANYNRDYHCSGVSPARRLTLLSKRILKLTSAIAIPFAALATTQFLFTKPAYAESWLDKAKRNGDVTNGPFANSGFANDIGFADSLKEALSIWNDLGSGIGEAIKWATNSKPALAEVSVKLLVWTYESVTNIVLQTPIFLFSNDWFKENMLSFSLLSVGLFTVMTMLNGIKKIIGSKKALDIKTIVKRYSLAVLGMGMSPFILESGLKFLNTISDLIISLGHSSIGPALANMSTSSLSLIDKFALVGFDILLIATLIPVFLQNGRRWFDLLALSSLTPFVLSAAVFDTNLLKQWMHSIKKIAAVQIMYAFNITMIGIFIFATKEAATGWALITKILIVVGGLNRMANPPNFVKRQIDSSNKDIIDMFKTIPAALSWKAIGVPASTGKKLNKKVKGMLKGKLS